MYTDSSDGTGLIGTLSVWGSIHMSARWYRPSTTGDNYLNEAKYSTHVRMDLKATAGTRSPKR